MVKLWRGVIVSFCVLACHTAPVVTPVAPKKAASQFVAPRNLQALPSPGGVPLASKVWSKKLNGVITDFNVAKESGVVLVSTGPDYENPGGARQNLLWQLDRKGHVMWKRPMKSPVRVQSIAPDGSLAVVSTYDDRITAYDARGRSIWSVEGMCKPIPLSRTKKVICYHDDDAEPEVAFDVFDWKGNKLLSYPVQNDVLAFKMASDQEHFAIGLSGGHAGGTSGGGVILFDGEFKPKWQAKVMGEVVDLGVSLVAGAEVRVAVLYDTDLSGGQRIAILGSNGTLLSDVAVGPVMRQLEIMPGANAVFAYGNSRQGQYLSYFGVPNVWTRGGARGADYSLAISVADRLVVGGFEEVVGTSKQSRLLGFAIDGSAVVEVPVAVPEGVYIYSFGMTIKGDFLAVALDDGTILGVRLLFDVRRVK